MVDNGVASDTAIDRNSPLPLYHQLKQTILRCILDENATPGECIPSEKEFEKRCHLSRITPVRRAPSDLAPEGYVARQLGRVTFVSPERPQHPQLLGGFAEDLGSQGGNVESRIVKRGWQPIPPIVAEKLGSGPCEVFYPKRLLPAESEPTALALGYLKDEKKILLALNELNKAPSILLKRKYGIMLRLATKTEEACLVSESGAVLHNTRPNDPPVRS